MKLRSTWPLLLGLLAGCGARSDKPTSSAGALCAQAAKRLAARLGPELSRVEVQRELSRPTGKETPPEAWACVLVYQPVPEELAEEGLPPEDMAGTGIDQQLAVAFKAAKGEPELHLLDPSPETPGPVSLELELQDVAAGPEPELVVSEMTTGADPWRGIRFVALEAGTSGPRDLLSASLKLKTAEGLDLFGAWKPTQRDGRRGITVEAGGASRIYAWNDATKTFALDQAATDAANPKPPAPPPPATEAPPTAPPSKKGKKDTKDKKAAPVKKTPVKPEDPLEGLGIE